MDLGCFALDSYDLSHLKMEIFVAQNVRMGC